MICVVLGTRPGRRRLALLRPSPSSCCEVSEDVGAQPDPPVSEDVGVTIVVALHFCGHQADRTRGRGAPEVNNSVRKYLI